MVSEGIRRSHQTLLYYYKGAKGSQPLCAYTFRDWEETGYAVKRSLGEGCLSSRKHFLSRILKWPLSLRLATEI
eukprot:612384-Karenia_brevis.AAC.1